MRRLCYITVPAFLVTSPAWAVDEANGPPPPLLSGNTARRSLTGEVTTGRGAPIPGAILQAGVTTAIADGQGNFRLTLDPDDYKLQVSAQCCSRDVGLLLDKTRRLGRPDGTRIGRHPKHLRITVANTRLHSKPGPATFTVPKSASRTSCRGLPQARCWTVSGLPTIQELAT